MTLPRNGNGWKLWLLGIAGTVIIMLLGMLVAIVGSVVDDAKEEHRTLFRNQQQILERLQKLENRK
jgi:hypothetical protein